MTRLVRLWACALIAAFTLIAGASVADAKRVALIVGNEAYAHVPGLATPARDAGDMARALREQGFEVTLLTDVGSEVFFAVLDTFAKQAADAEAVLFYYSGHAVQTGGVNRLVPVSASMDSAEALLAETWALNDIAARLKSTSGQTLIFLDACRTSPLSEALQAGAPDGLAQFDGGSGTFVAFATRPGAVAWDQAEGSENSPFTKALLAHLDTPAQSISDLMIKVRNDVDAETGGKQTPWDQSSLREQFYFAPGAAPAPEPVVSAPAPAPADDPFAGFEVVEAASIVGPPAAVLAAAAKAVGVDLPVIQRIAAAELPRLAGVGSETRSLKAVAPGGAAELRVIGVDPAAQLAAAALPGPAPAVPVVAAPLPEEMTRAVQAELKRIGCYTSVVDGDWGPGSRAAMRRYLEAKKVAKSVIQGDGEMEPREAMWRQLLTEPEGTCKPPPAPVKAAAKKQPSKPKATQPSQQATKTAPKKPAAEQPKAQAPAAVAAPKKGVKCTFMVVAVVCK